MKTKLFFMAAVAATLAIASCSKEDDNDPTNPKASVPDPAGTITLNMMNRDNGWIYLPDTTIYIDRGDNFTNGGFVDLGDMKGVGNIPSTPVFDGLTRSCAVIPGHGYWIYSYEYPAYTFPSGKKAMYIGVKSFRLYVDSWIISTINSIMGAVVKYIPYEDKYGLRYIGRMNLSKIGDTFTVTLTEDPKGDVEWAECDAIKMNVSGKTLTFTLESEISTSQNGYLRAGDFYATLYLY